MGHVEGTQPALRESLGFSTCMWVETGYFSLGVLISGHEGMHFINCLFSSLDYKWVPLLNGSNMCLLPSSGSEDVAPLSLLNTSMPSTRSLC